MFKLNRTPAIQKNVLYQLYSMRNVRSHYDVLGITPHATQTEIKTAYYKLSMVYHPDKNVGQSAATVNDFRDITAAYEILRNFRLRKLYDKGILHTAGPQWQQQGASGPTAEDDAQTRFYKAHMSKSKPPPPDGRTPIYNFDEWSRAHYGDTFARQNNARRRWNKKQAQNLQEVHMAQKENVITAIAIVVLAIVVLSYATKTNHDDVIVGNYVSKRKNLKNDLDVD